MYAKKEDGQGEFYYHDQPWSLPHAHTYNPIRSHDPFHVLPPTSSYQGLLRKKAHSHLFPYETGSVFEPGLAPLTTQEIMDAKALAASKSHSEAERRRREKINNHLAKLRSLLPSTTKTDKATLLAEVIQHLKELKRETSLIFETKEIPTETDELTVVNTNKRVIRATLCCQDRTDLLPELIEALKSLRLRTVKAEITTLGGRVRNVLSIACDENQQHLNLIEKAFKNIMEKTAATDESSSRNVKRQRISRLNVQRMSF